MSLILSLLTQHSIVAMDEEEERIHVISSLSESDGITLCLSSESFVDYRFLKAMYFFAFAYCIVVSMRAKEVEGRWILLVAINTRVAFCRPLSKKTRCLFLRRTVLSKYNIQYQTKTVKQTECVSKG